MNLILKLFHPRLSGAIHRLGQKAGLTHPTQHLHNTMSNLSSSEEIATIELAAKVIIDQKAALANAVQQLTPLADENLSLRDIIRGLESEDAASDAALASLRDMLPTPEPATEPEAPADEATEEDTSSDPPSNEDTPAQ